MSVKNADYYPSSIESYWLSSLLKAFPGEDRSSALEKLEEPIQALSDAFTCERPRAFKNYGKAAEALLGYGIFYYPQTWTRVRFPLIEAHDLRGWTAPQDRPVKILDLGAGLGAASTSLAQLCIDRFGSSSAEIMMIDHSAEALLQAHGAVQALNSDGYTLSLLTQKGDFRKYDGLPNPKKDTFDLIVISFAINEAFGPGNDKKAYAWLRKLKPLLNPQSLILIAEPAMRETSEQLYRISDRVAKDSIFEVWGPQLHISQCPAHYQDKFWTHEVREWSPPSSLKEINRTLWRSIEDLKFSYATFGNASATLFESSKTFLRLVSPMSRMKGHYLLTGIATDGKKYIYDIPTRGYNRDELFALDRINRGDIIEIAEVEEMEDRLRIPRPEDIIYHFSPT
ncbi:MAG: class I SAM-dependent methyltransferase [Opitutales bacterium]|nr:class I SAM-dependent methyltransferase [Opitutales bacterium]